MYRKIFTTVASIPLLIYLLLSIFVGVQLHKDNPTNSDAIIVLGAKAYKDDSYNPCLVKRVEHAVGLYNQDFADKLIMTGGYDLEDGASEAEIMKEIAVDRGILSEDIILEKNASSTYENLLYSKTIAKENNLNSYIIVTEKFHAPRAMLVANSLDMNVTVSSADSVCWSRWKYVSRYFLREPIVIGYYFLTQRIVLN